MWSRQVWADYSMSLGILQARQPRWREIGVVVTRVAEVARGHRGPPWKSLDSDENFKPEHTLF